MSVMNKIIKRKCTKKLEAIGGGKIKEFCDEKIGNAKDFYNDKIKPAFEKKPAEATVSFFWKGLALFLLGVVVGFMIAPIKRGFRIGCNNGCNNGNNSPVTDNECSLEGSVDVDNGETEE